MPRRRTSNKPIRRRIKLNHKGDALTEMCRTFRAVKNGDLARADGVRDITMLDKIHSGMPEHTAIRTAAPVIINVFSVPTNYFLSDVQIEALKRNELIIDVNECTPMLPDEVSATTPRNNVTPLRALEAPSSQDEERKIVDLKSEINSLAKKMGIDVVL